MQAAFKPNSPAVFSQRERDRERERKREKERLNKERAGGGTEGRSDRRVGERDWALQGTNLIQTARFSSV